MPKTPKENNGHTDTTWAKVDAIVLLMLEDENYIQAKRLHELKKTVMEKFGIAERMAQELIKIAKREMRKIGREKVERAKTKALRDREYLFRKAKTKEDFVLALKVAQDRDKICGLYVDQVKQTGEMTVKNVDMSKMTEHGLERLKRGDSIESVLSDPKSVKQNG